jgi:leucyl/phenylalanyl-tRNA--protein transferase
MTTTQVHIISPNDPETAFPPVASALEDPNGLLAIGGKLSTTRLLTAYKSGIFPWYSEGEPVLWWSPDPRAILYADQFHCSRSLRRKLRRNDFQVSVNQCFERVITLCGEIRADSGTWITGDMTEAFLALHELGHAYSIETWSGNELIGGLYGVRLGRVFFGESMFSLQPDGSKTAMVALVHLANKSHIRLIDCQLPSAHLSRLGTRLISRNDFVAQLADQVILEPENPVWTSERIPTSTLVIA